MNIDNRESTKLCRRGENRKLHFCIETFADLKGFFSLSLNFVSIAFFLHRRIESAMDCKVSIAIEILIIISHLLYKPTK